MKYENMIMKITAGKEIAEVNGNKIDLDCPVEIVSGRIFVPLRFISETLGAKVDYNRVDKQIIILR